ncbi:uncharacterized protein LOC141533534 [Cotesia typhae]|uniref:uncharacterized protein LOC141533534 n=1 Tax=Cotesia typhae TaxID=2053667 RepID=UPI003D6816E7
MGNEQLFNVGDLFASYDEFEAKLIMYQEKEKYSFTSTTAKKLESMKNLRQDYNCALKYDERYFRCSVNPKPVTVREFNKKYPHITVKLCPAALTVRTTKDKQFLRITAFMPDHDHEPHALPRLQMYSEMAEKCIAQGGGRKKGTQAFSTQPASLPKKNALETFDEQDQDLSDNTHVLPFQETASSLEAYNDVVDSAIVLEDNFNELLMKLQINIVASTNEEEKKNKLLQVNEMLVFFNKDLVQYHVQSRDEEISSKLNGGSLTIHSRRSRGRGKGRQLRPIGLPIRRISSNSKTFENMKKTAKSFMVLSMIIKERSVINDIVLGNKKFQKMI